MPSQVAGHGASVCPVGFMAIDPGQSFGGAALHFQAVGHGVNGPGILRIEAHGAAAQGLSLLKGAVFL